MTDEETPLAKSKVQSRCCPVLAAQAWPAPWSEKELTFSRLSTPSVRVVPTASEVPLLVTLTVKVCPEFPNLAEASGIYSLSLRDALPILSTEAVSVASVGWPAAEAVAVLDTVAGATEEATA